jgi:hypothetical protein
MSEHLKTYQPQVNLAGITPKARVEIVQRVVGELLTSPRIMADWRFVHFSTQSWFLQFAGRVMPRHIVPMVPGRAFMEQAIEALTLPAVAVGRHNPLLVDLSAALQSKR